MTMRDKANYGGGKRDNLLGGLKTRSPYCHDASNKPIGSKYPSVDTDANRKEPSKQDPTVGPRTA